MIGVDIGTHSLRAVLVDRRGAVLAKARIPYSRAFRQAGWAEQSAETWERALEQAVREVTAGEDAADIKAICLAQQRGAVVPADGEGEPLIPALCDSDQRGQGPLNEVVRLMGAGRLYETTGCPAVTFVALPKLLWVKESLPDVWDRTALWLTPHDYIVRKLTGRAVSTGSAMLRTGLLDLRKPQSYAGELLRHIGVEASRLPELKAPTDIVGRVSREAAAKLGLAEGTPIVGGLGDQSAGAIAMGVGEGEAALNLGTSFVMTVPVAEPRFDPERKCTIELYPPIGYAVEIGSGAGTNMIDWMRDSMFGEMDGCEAELTRLAEQVPPGADGLEIVPSIWGAVNGKSGASISGITHRHGRGHLFRALLEGLALDVERTRDKLAATLGALPGVVYAFGGAAQNPLFCRILADALQVRLIAASMPEASAYGAAVHAAVGLGWHPSHRAAAKKMNLRGAVYAPSTGNAAAARR